MNFFSALTFLNPWFLFAFLAVPLLILLLRVIPPPPKQVTLATARFLEKLVTQKRTSHKTPWWLLVLRTLILFFIILAFAHPVMRKDTSAQLTKPVLLIIDNSWSAAQNWEQLILKATHTLRDAQSADLTVRLALTAPLPGQEKPLLKSADNPATLKSFINGLTPEAWQGKDGSLAQILDGENDENMDVVWLSSGLTSNGSRQLYNEVSDYASLKIYHPNDAALPLVLSNEKDTISSHNYLISRAVPSQINQAITLLGQNKNNTVLEQNSLSFSGNALTVEFEHITEKSVRSEKLRVAGQTTAASVLLLGKGGEKPYVGIATSDAEESDSTFTDSEYYLTRALQPFAKVTVGTPQTLLEEKNLSVLILPDISTLPIEQLDKLEKWINKGGLLLRFGGPSTAQIDQLPTAVPMQKGERALGGDLTWEQTQTLAEFSESSPFYGLELSDNITLKKHLLAKPEETKPENIWASLSDGIPFVTAAKYNRGLVVYIHTTADPSWSDFPLTGMYIEILKKIISMSDRPAEAFQQSAKGNVFLSPVLVLNAKGELVKPSPLFKSFSIAEQDTIEPNSLNPPGIYSYKGLNKALNLGNTIGQIEPTTTLNGNESLFSILDGNNERDFKPLLLKIALLLFFVDWAVMLYLMRLSDNLKSLFARYKRQFSSLIILSFLCFIPANISYAQNNDINNISNMHLAYFKTGNAFLDNKSRNGLTQLQNTLIARTSVEPYGVMPLDIENDTLLFYPFIYWYVTVEQQSLSEKAKTKLQSYIENGGLVIVDLGTPAAVQSGSSETEFFLSLVDGINLPPLQQISDNHPLRRSFYLLDKLHGRYDSPNVWASYDPDNLENSVAGLIIGGNDWAGAWASGTNEMANRTGINLTMYALTGNYKSDQLHLPFILERLGQ